MIKFLELLTESIGWLRIFASPFLIGLFLAAVAWFNLPQPYAVLLAVLLIALGAFIGGYWATKMWKSTGTMRFLSRTMATPELDKKEEENKNS